MPAEREYVHGYAAREHARLIDQATTLAELLQSDTVYPAGSTVLEAGCGVGAQTFLLARNNPGAKITSFDLSGDSLLAARKRAASEDLRNVAFLRGDIFHPPFRDESFDHVFLCFVLEHLQDPVEALRSMHRVLRPGGTITVTEGDHGSAYFHPDSPDARETIRCLVEIQSRMGGNSLIGRQLYPLLGKAGYGDPKVSPKVIYVDSGRPAMVEGFTKNTFIAMVEGVREQAIRADLVTEAGWERGIRDLYRTTEEDGTFLYTFFKGTARKRTQETGTGGERG